MPTITIETNIDAPAEICFDLMRDIRPHTETTGQTNEKAIAWVSDGMLGLGQTVTFEETHFGMRQRLTVKVTQFERPTVFVDEMIEGPFVSFKHTHQFFDRGGVTLMVDKLEWVSPYGVLGRIFDKLLLENHLSNLVRKRNSRLKAIVEASRAAG
jgi:ligand-binding SRPBCC domain-containing protein